MDAQAIIVVTVAAAQLWHFLNYQYFLCQALTRYTLPISSQQAAVQ